MKQLIVTSLIISMVLSLGVAFAGPKGNGAPSGPHFNLNLIGVKDGKVKDIDDCGNGHRIFVKLGNTGKKTTKINLVSCEEFFEVEPDNCPVDFAVLDCDGTDDGEATFMLPNPDPGKANTTKYSVWVRALGSPKGDPTATIQTCAYPCLLWNTAGTECLEYATGDDYVCSTEVVELTRSKGQMKFEDVSRELLTMCVWVWNETAGDWEMERVYLFDEAYENYFWKYDNNGVKLVQMRFYLEEMEYTGADWQCRDQGGWPKPPIPE